MTPFNKPHVTGKELSYISQALEARKLSGDGLFTKLCQSWLEDHLGSGRSLLTTSCTDALEASALLIDLMPGDEVILPSYTFVSTANAFVLRGAKLRFADSRSDHPNMNVDHVKSLITSRTRAICVVHYAGVAVDMDPVMELAKRHNLVVVEDAAQAIDAQYKSRPLGTIGALATFSFHETKNVNAGEGGSLHVNDKALITRAEIIREKGTNRSSFFRGEIDKYGWVDVGSSFLPSELIAAFLFAQLEDIAAIQERRMLLWNTYDRSLRDLSSVGNVLTPMIPQWADHNAHMYYLVLDSLQKRNALMRHLRDNGIMTTFHYSPLHASHYFKNLHDGPQLPQAMRYGDCLMRLPLFNDLRVEEVERISKLCIDFLN